MANPNTEMLLARLIESSDIFVKTLSHALSQSINSPFIFSGQLHDRVLLVQEWSDDWSRILAELADGQ